MLTFSLGSFLVQIVSLLVLCVGLNKLIFGPMLEVIEERDRRTSGARHDAVAMRGEAERDAAEYERKMQQARTRIGTETDSARAATGAEERAIQADARRRSSEQLTELRSRLAAQAEQARQALAGEVGSLAEQIFERVVGRPR